MSVFHRMMNDIFSNKDFTEFFQIDGLTYTCIVSPIHDDISFTDAGLASGENFTLDIKLPVFKMPKINDRLMFRDKWYKIDTMQIDSANASIKIFIIAQSKGIGA